MAPTFKNWVIGTISSVILTIVAWIAISYLTPFEISLLESWGLTSLMLVASSGVSIYNKTNESQ